MGNQFGCQFSGMGTNLDAADESTAQGVKRNFIQIYYLV